jgi:hypothetical protein
MIALVLIIVMSLLKFKDLEVKSDPELCLPATDNIPIEGLADVSPLQLLHEFEMHGKTQKVGLESESERACSVIPIAYGKVILVHPEKAVILCRKALHSRPAYVGKKSTTYGPEKPQESGPLMYDRDPKFEISKPGFGSREGVVIRGADLVIAPEIGDIWGFSKAPEQLKP